MFPIDISNDKGVDKLVLKVLKVLHWIDSKGRKHLIVNKKYDFLFFKNGKVSIKYLEAKTK